MNENQIRHRADHPIDTGKDQAQLSAMLLVLDELRAIRKLLEPEVRTEVAASEPEAPAHPLQAVHPLRPEWDSMLPHQRAHFASFKAYAEMRDQLEAPAPEDESLLPAYVWLERNEISEPQERGAIGHDIVGRYAIRIEDLTPMQKSLLKL